MDCASDIFVDDIGAEPERSKSNISGATGGLVALPVLWHFPISHFNEKVRWTLDLKRIPHRAARSCPDYLFRSLVGDRATAVPVLVLDGRRDPRLDAHHRGARGAYRRRRPSTRAPRRHAPPRARARGLARRGARAFGPSAMLVARSSQRRSGSGRGTPHVGMRSGRRSDDTPRSPGVPSVLLVPPPHRCARASRVPRDDLAALDRLERELQRSGLPRRGRRSASPT